MKANITISTGDAFWLLLHGHIRNKIIMGMQALLLLIILASNLPWLFSTEVTAIEVLILVLDLVTWFFIFFLAGFTATLAGTLLNRSWRKGRLGEHQITLTESGFTEETEYNRSEIFWPAVEKLEPHRRGLYIKYVNGDFFIFPKVGFSSTASWAEFSYLVEKKWEIATRKTRQA